MRDEFGVEVDENGYPIGAQAPTARLPAPLTMEQQQAAAQARINALFRLEPSPAPPQDTRTRAWDIEQPPTRSWDVSQPSRPDIPGRQSLYDQVYKNNYDASKMQLDDQAEKTRRNLSFALADKGLFGGSADIDANAMENRGYGQALVKAADTAQGASDSVRSNDERTRLNLLSSIRAGADSDTASQSALSQMQDNLSAGRATSTSGALDAYLSSVGPVLNQQQQQQGVIQARNQYGSNGGIYGRPGNYSGQTSK